MLSSVEQRPTRSNQRTQRAKSMSAEREQSVPEVSLGVVSVSGYLIGNQEAGWMPLSPAAELKRWYRYYLRLSAVAPVRQVSARFREADWQRRTTVLFMVVGPATMFGGGSASFK
jgi:hypothetical protein